MLDRFNVVMPLSSADGYGYSGEELVLWARKEGVDIRIHSHDWVEDIYTDPELTELVDGIAANKEYDPAIPLVVYFIPYAFYHFRANAAVGMTMFETTEIPDVWKPFCEIPKGLIVPSEFNKEVFGNKVDTHIEVVPLGVNPDTYPYIDREPANEFTFLMAGLLHYRKGAEFAVRAFKEEFDEGEPVRLVLKTRKNFLDIGREELRSDIDVVNWNYSRSEMLDLYHAADCFVSCSRGEASGLTPREAMSTGLPAIVTNWGGLAEIADPRYTYPLEIDGLEPAPATCSSYDMGITQGCSIGEFSTPSVSHLRELMRSAYENQEQNRLKGQEASRWIQSEWSYQKCAVKWLNAIERIVNG